MISHLRGKIIDSGERYIVIDVSGVGYKVFVTDDTLQKLSLNSDTSLQIYTVVREDAFDLYGFISKKEKGIFELLISISGIGPKSALNILSIVSGETLASAVQSGSISHLVKVSGIGKKTAEKIVLELRDKLGGFVGDDSQEWKAGMSSDADAIEALKALGYDADEAREALKSIDKNIKDTGAKVKAALKHLL
jgi:Holliday junction DNA helicase RuvA